MFLSSTQLTMPAQELIHYASFQMALCTVVVFVQPFKGPRFVKPLQD